MTSEGAGSAPVTAGIKVAEVAARSFVPTAAISSSFCGEATASGQVSARGSTREDLVRTTFRAEPLEPCTTLLADDDGVWDVVEAPLEFHDDQQAMRTGSARRSTSANGSTLALVDSPVRFGGQPNARSRAPKHGEHGTGVA